MTSVSHLMSEKTAWLRRHHISAIWLIPLIAALAAAWLGWRTLSARGPTITIVFANAEGLEPGKTKIEHNSLEIGQIEALEPTTDLTHVIATARMSKFAKNHLTEGTRFWIVRPRLSVEGISGLSTLISGAYVELDPGSGRETHRFTALEEPPLINANEAGRIFTLHRMRLGSIAQGDPLYYRGLKVGQVLGYDLSNGNAAVNIRVFVRTPYDKLVREGTRFWNASGITVTAGSDGFKIRSESLLTLLAGGIDFDVPLGAEPGDIAKTDTPFTLYDDEGEANQAIFTRTVRFLLYFPGAVDNLVAGAPVRMRGVQIGRVVDVHMEFDAAIDRLSVPVVIEIEAERVKLLNETAAPKEFAQRAYATFGRFVARGLRARLGSGSLLTGQKVVNLDFVPDGPPLKLIEGGVYPEIPTSPSNDLDTVMSAAKDVLSGLQVTVAKLNGILSSPELTRSLHSLDESLDNLSHITRDAREGIGPLISALRKAADSADGTLAAAHGAIDSHRAEGGDLAGTLREIKTAARSVRVLADYLESHPDSLLLGRSKAAKP